MLSSTAARENVYTQSSQSRLKSSSFSTGPPCAFIWTFSFMGPLSWATRLGAGGGSSPGTCAKFRGGDAVGWAGLALDVA